MQFDFMCSENLELNVGESTSFLHYVHQGKAIISTTSAKKISAVPIMTARLPP